VPDLKLNGLLALYAASKGPKAKFATLLQVRRRGWRAARRVALAPAAAAGGGRRRRRAWEGRWSAAGAGGGGGGGSGRGWSSTVPAPSLRLTPQPPPPPQALRFAAAHKALAAQLAPSARGRAHEWAQEWGLPDKDAHDLYLAAAQLLKVGADSVCVWGELASGGSSALRLGGVIAERAR
jgi:hypothetical protein